MKRRLGPGREREEGSAGPAGRPAPSTSPCLPLPTLSGEEGSLEPGCVHPGALILLLRRSSSHL